MQKKLKRVLACMLAVVMVLCAVPVSGEVVKAGAVDIPSDAVEFNGHYYKVYKEDISWEEAKKRCESLGGHLATITSESEQSIISKITTWDALGAGYNLWLGGIYNEDSGNWEWYTGETWSYSRVIYDSRHLIWGADVIKNHCNRLAITGEVDLSILGKENKWNDAEDGIILGIQLRIGFICEWESEQFPDGYDFNTDRWFFKNQSTEISKLKYYILFGINNGNKIYSQDTDHGTHGQCYGMASTTASINTHDDLLSSFGQQNLVDVNLQDNSDMIAMTAADFIQYGQLAQNGIEYYNDLDQLYRQAKDYTQVNTNPVVVGIFGSYNGGTAGHALYVVGIKEDNDDKCVLLVDDSNYRGLDNGEPLCLKELTLLKKDGKICGWRYHMWDGLDWGEDSNKNIKYSYPAELIYQIGLAFKEKWGFAKNYGVLTDNETLLVTDSVSLTVSCASKSVNIEDNTVEENELMYPLCNINNPEAFNGYYWIKSKDCVTFSNIEEDSVISLSDEDSGIEVSVPKDSILKVEIPDNNEDTAEVLTEKGESVKLNFQNADNTESVLSMTVSGTASSDTVTATQTEAGLVVTGISDGTVTLSKDDEVIETRTITNSVSDIEITYDKAGENEDVSLDYEHGHTDADSDGKCDTCGETMDAVKTCTHLCHKTGFLGFIWKILNLFNRLFDINPVCSCGMKHY